MSINFYLVYDNNSIIGSDHVTSRPPAPICKQTQLHLPATHLPGLNLNPEQLWLLAKTKLTGAVQSPPTCPLKVQSAILFP